MNTLVWYWVSTMVLAVMLFFPMSKLIWVMQVRRMERKGGRPTTEEEQQHQRRRARIWAAAIAITFAFLYNRTLVPL